ncbi:mat a-1 [Dichotomopilus funicola]|uniref:Mat a-1 n=1 Tax=Dichotomopilus funicola TaxID=1934379 RepID=A0AAN6UWV9_9PEZI|nr:mat a-1 [Dichotomopilus funicola]
MATDIAAQLADPAMIKFLGAKYWNHFAIQLGHWNTMKVVIMDEEMFRLIPTAVKIEIAREMTKYLEEPVMYARDCDNKSVWILGPIRIMHPDTTVVGNVPVWDPKKKLVPPPDLKKLPRPQNAYILYRKDMQNKVKADNPNLHNNEISILTGAMWKSETPEVRAKYHHKAAEIKAEFMLNNPDYRYTPRRPSEIRRRVIRPPGFQHSAHVSALDENRREGLKITSEITSHIPAAQRFLPPVAEAGWTPYHLVPGASTPTEPALEDTGDDEAATPDEQIETPAAEPHVDADAAMNDARGPLSMEEIMDGWDAGADITQILAHI